MRTSNWVMVLFLLGFSLVGPAILIAISRYRLYEIDRIVNRAVLYGLLTAIIAGTSPWYGTSTMSIRVESFSSAPIRWAPEPAGFEA